MAADKLKLRVVTPAGSVLENGAAELECEAVRLWIPDDEKGRGGGSIGIHPGHCDCLMALGNGELIAVNGEETLLNKRTNGGFAMVKDGVVTVFTESAE